MAVGSRRNTNAYKIFPIYSKVSDQFGPFNGLVSPHPRISKPVGHGIINSPSTMQSTNFQAATCIIIGK